MSDPYSGPPGPYQHQPSWPPEHQAYGPPAYQPYGYYPPPRRTNGLAIAALVVSCASFFVCALLGGVGAVLGHVARKQIRETGEEGDGLALAGIIVGWILTGLSLLLIVGYIVFIVVMVRSGAPS